MPARDLSEFAYPGIFLDTKKVSIVWITDTSSLVPVPDLPLGVVIGCDGLQMKLDFKLEERELRNSCFEFFKNCITENAK